MTVETIARRFLSPDRNVGGADMGTRVFATLISAALTVLVLPRVAIPYPLMKIALLSASELGLAILMLGMFLRSKTYNAGLVLFFASVIMFWATAKGHNYLAFAIGAIHVVLASVEIFTRRSPFNSLFGIRSTTAASVPSAAALVEEVLEEDKPTTGLTV